MQACYFASLCVLLLVSHFITLTHQPSPDPASPGPAHGAAPSLPGPGATGRWIKESPPGYAPASTLGRQYPGSSTPGLTLALPSPTSLSGGRRSVGRMPWPLPVPLLDGNHGRWPLSLSSSGLSTSGDLDIITFDPHGLLT